MLQNSLASTHSALNCLDCLAYKTQSFDSDLSISQINDLHKLDAIKSSIDSILKEMFIQLTSKITINDAITEMALASKLENQLTGKLNFESLEPKAREPALSTEFLRLQAAEYESKVSSDGQASETCSQKKVKSVPKVDRMKNLGFKAQFQKDLIAELELDKDDNSSKSSNKWNPEKPSGIKSPEMSPTKSKRRNYALFCSKLNVESLPTDAEFGKFNLKEALKDLFRGNSPSSSQTDSTQGTN